MALWTFMTLVGNGKRVHVDQVRAGDFRLALKTWSQSIDIEGMTEKARSRMATRELPDDALTELEWRRGSGVWMFGCDFEMDVPPDDWGNQIPTVWVIKTDDSPLSQGELF